MSKSVKKVFVSGCFDLLNAGHIEFLSEASKFGILIVGLGSDNTILYLKGKEPVNSEAERKYMLEALSCVDMVVINKGHGILDFIDEIKEIHPDIFIVNEDGHTPEKESLCSKLGIRYEVLKRKKKSKGTFGSKAYNNNGDTIPYRIDLAGTWIDQPYVSRYNPGWAITASIEPTIMFNERSGMATSTRNKASELWNNQLPLTDPEKLAKILFRYDNEPGTKDVSGSQDSIGICLPGINRFYYEKGKYWPSKFETITDVSVINWLEKRLFMIMLWPRPIDFVVLEKTDITKENVSRLTLAADKAWDGLKRKDIKTFSEGFLDSFNSQIRMFPKMINNKIKEVIDSYRDKALAWKLSGAGGGGYLILISETDIPNSIKVKIRVKDYWLE